jgi:hypothetical protein
MYVPDDKKPADAEAAPPPPPPTPKSVSKPADPITATGAKAGFDPMRPFRYAWGFISGTVTHTLNGISTGARKGMLFGAIACVALAFLAPALLPTMMATNVLAAGFYGGVGGAMLGATLGALVGFATGGVKGVGRQHRGEKYAEDLLEKQKAKRIYRAADGPDLDDYREAHQDRNNYITDRIRQIQMENSRDNRTYWQDHVKGSSGQGQGQGF